MKERLTSLVEKFIKTERNQAGVKTNLPPEKVIGPVEEVIREKNKEKEIKAEVRGNKIYLVRKKE